MRSMLAATVAATCLAQPAAAGGSYGVDGAGSKCIPYEGTPGNLMGTLARLGLGPVVKSQTNTSITIGWGALLKRNPSDVEFLSRSLTFYTSMEACEAGARADE